MKNRLKVRKSKFFESYIDKYGKFFMDYITGADASAILRLKRNMKTLIRDIAFGNVSAKYSQYFTPQFNLWLLEVVQAEYERRRVQVNIFNWYCKQFPNDTKAFNMLMEYRGKYQAYDILYNNIYRLNMEGDFNIILTLPNALRVVHKNSI